MGIPEKIMQIQELHNLRVKYILHAVLTFKNRASYI
jgi:hypothetical protein